MKRLENLTANLDVTLARTKGSLAVAQGPVVAVYGLDLVDPSPAIYVIHPACVAGVDEVVARPGEYVVIAFAGEDLVVAAAALDRVVAAATVEVVIPSATLELVVRVAPYEGIV